MPTEKIINEKLSALQNGKLVYSKNSKTIKVYTYTEHKENKH